MKGSKSFNEIFEGLIFEAGRSEPLPGSILPDQKPDNDIPSDDIGKDTSEPENDKPEITDDNLDYFAGLLRDALKFDPKTLSASDKAVFAMKLDSKNAPTVIEQIAKIIGNN